MIISTGLTSYWGAQKLSLPNLSTERTLKRFSLSELISHYETSSSKIHRTRLCCLSQPQTLPPQLRQRPEDTNGLFNS